MLPRPSTSIPLDVPRVKAPSETDFISTFGNILPPASFLTINDANVAYYSLPPVTSSKTPSVNRVLLVHGVHTSAIGLLPFANALQSSFPSTHFVFFDLYGHGISDAPIVPYTRSRFHALIDALLDRLAWPSAHMIGYSFGGATAVSYTALHPSRVQSLAIVGPAGLLRPADYSVEHLRGENEAEVTRFTLDWLEGGPLVVPADWKERTANGEVVAAAVRDWQNRNHPAHIAAVVGIVRDGGVFDSHTFFAQASKTGIPSVAVLGELDDVCTTQDLVGLGFTDVTVVPGAGHGVIRENVNEVAEVVERFWRQIA